MRYSIRGSHIINAVCTKNFNLVAFIHVKADLFVKFVWFYSSISNTPPIYGPNALLLLFHLDILTS